MKLVIVAMMVLFSAGNVLAQSNDAVSLPLDPNAGTGTTGGTTTEFDYNATYQACLSEHADDPDFKNCCTDYASCERQQTDSERLLTDVAANRGQSPSELAEQDCRTRNGFFSENAGCECTTTEHPNHQWVSSSGTEHECCVENVNAYNRRRDVCRSDGTNWDPGEWSCRGGCRCPYGTALDDDGHCLGSAASREDVRQMRERITQLEREQLQLQQDLATAQGNDQSQTDEIQSLTDRITAATGELDRLRGLLALREQQLTEALGRLPPASTTPPPPLPGTTSAIAEAAGETEPGPMAPTPPPEEGEEEGHFCNRSFGGVLLCYILPAAALAGLGVGIACAAGACDEDDGTIRYSYH